MMKCESCSHFDGEYCCSGIVEGEDVKVSRIPNVIKETIEKYGDICECPYEEVE